eukprot:Gregarina_sp_Poly_1__3101@NODE_1873_length_3156_cov_119_227582_g1215_i0_p4_GENE_NODE_1873_length_3156_cov_119_227582_g1215_i0NODE_1873_length_3156_cov_119_227582_g1215_i0_p4_ORF_typecomplete_len129_score7_46Spo12/PF05032_12/0_12_NODE_1873_length_3156_cov_119_227582_g1215_i011461532
MSWRKLENVISKVSESHIDDLRCKAETVLRRCQSSGTGRSESLPMEIGGILPVLATLSAREKRSVVCDSPVLYSDLASPESDEGKSPSDFHFSPCSESRMESLRCDPASGREWSLGKTGKVGQIRGTL